MSERDPLRGCDVLPPMSSPSAPVEDDAARRHPGARSEAVGAPTTKGRAAGRFGVLNRFADDGARLVDTTAQACWWILYHETKPDGLATISHGRVADCIGVDRKTVTRATKRLEQAGLLTVVRHGGWRRGPSTYRVHPTPKQPKPDAHPSTTREP